MPAAGAQVIDVAVINSGNNRVAQYDATTGAVVNVNFITGSIAPQGLVLDGNNHLLVSTTGSVRQYDANTGGLVNGNFITGLSGIPLGLAIDANNHLFVANSANGTVGEYDATTGSAINPNFVTGLSGTPQAIAIDANNHLFVANSSSGAVGEFNATTGAVINPTFITGPSNAGDVALGPLNQLLVPWTGAGEVGQYDATTGAGNPNFISTSAPEGVACDSSNHLFVAFGSVNSAIREFNATTGAAINPNFVTGIPGIPLAPVVAPTPVPEPSSLFLLAATATPPASSVAEPADSRGAAAVNSQGWRLCGTPGTCRRQTWKP